MGLDTSIVAAIEAGRPVILPDQHRAAALGLAWARLQLDAGREAWFTPTLLTWDAWLARQWQRASQRGLVPVLQLLSPAQERVLWQQVLEEMSLPQQDPDALLAHAAALMRAAGRATQSLLNLSRSAFSEEEKLLAAALVEVRRHCAVRGVLSLRLAPPELLVGALADSPAPAVAGVRRLTPLQELLQAECWPRMPLLQPPPAAQGDRPRAVQALNADAELVACARWCESKLRANPDARLLVLSASKDPGPDIQGAALWSLLAPEQRSDQSLRSQMLVVEGGEPLQHQMLVSDALTALELVREQIETEWLLKLLRSPYVPFGTAAQQDDLSHWLRSAGMARWQAGVLRSALAEPAQGNAAAGALLGWLELLHLQLVPRGRRQAAAGWAATFGSCLQALRFAADVRLDSREVQRLTRWHELLDELAALDQFQEQLDPDAALQCLRSLAAQARHQEATGDAAVTLSTNGSDPVASYDGIWVLGMTDVQWPAPPRPDAYVSIAEQRRSRWPEASVAERHAEAQWAFARWRARTPDLVLSCALRDGDIRNRPAQVLMREASAWDAEATVPAVPGCVMERTGDMALPAVEASTLARPLGGGVERLRVQQACAFRAQMHWRLGAKPPSRLSEGVTALLRGGLLHALLQELWTQLREQAGLLALNAEAEAALIDDCWQLAVRAHPEAGWLSPDTLQRERDRARQVVLKVLALERQRTPFAVQDCERSVQWRAQGAGLRLRIDRIDQLPDGSRVLIDYKSGEAGSIKLHEGALEPLQLALYVCALAAAGEEVGAAALLGLKHSKFGYSGVAAAASPLPARLKPVADWGAAVAGWEGALLGLMRAHLSGEAGLAVDARVCLDCHLPALCRRAGLDDPESGDE